MSKKKDKVIIHYTFFGDIEYPDWESVWADVLTTTLIFLVVAYMMFDLMLPW